ncbi:FAS1-like dehydratase domain-containing protein [Janibacter limosus]|uniref:FAS1-like dehydratase domain-containing protein n=1 Tax=Janibacter limosus TaxID=53458 RepID=UPI0008320ED1|nr:MaoC family dehydratase N-terminal domain-containing protein [Janibacter limosus]
MPTSNISEAMTTAVGTQLARTVSHPVSESDIRKWALAVYWPEPAPALFFDPDHAAATVNGGIVAPEEFNPFAWSVAEHTPHAPDAPVEPNNPDNTEIQAGIEGPGLRFQLNGGMAVEYGVRIRPGDVITSARVLGEYTEREGRLGLMLFSHTQDTWTNQDDELVKRTITTLIRY